MSAESRLARLERLRDDLDSPPQPIVTASDGCVLEIYDPREGPAVIDPSDVRPRLSLPDNKRALRPAPDATGFMAQDIPEPSPE